MLLRPHPHPHSLGRAMFSTGQQPPYSSSGHGDTSQAEHLQVSIGRDHSFSWFNLAWTSVPGRGNLQEHNCLNTQSGWDGVRGELFQKGPDSCPSERHVLCPTNCFMLYSPKSFCPHMDSPYFFLLPKKLYGLRNNIQENGKCSCTLVSLKTEFMFMKKSVGIETKQTKLKRSGRQQKSGEVCRNSNSLGQSRPYGNESYNSMW